ncbi:MAG TPA: zinc ABC transporter substrate-binding protein [Candidatus Nanoarchaeia archaeon]|nr:zinc ABC transporter substrate-binding protein [Candidatus Nanoarchaeia archaeon]
MRKITYAIVGVLVAVIIVAAVVTGLYLNNNKGTTSSSTLQVLTTFYPIYDFAQNVGGDKVNVSLLVPETVDVHDFEPTPSDIAKVSSADVLIYSGAGLEPWIQSVISAAGSSHLITVDTSKGITLIPVSAQFQQDNRTIDPHIWLNPENAKQQVNNILQGLIKADPTDASYFTQNANAYQSKLDELNTEAINATTNTATNVFITFHEAFAYFAHQYNVTQLSILGPFEEEPTPTDIQNVVTTINQYHLKYVGYESLENPAIAQSIGSQTNATLINMNPIEGLTTQEKANGDNYISLMKQDIANIHLALSTVGS